MLDYPPTEKEWQSWLYAGIWSLLIFLTVPLARALQEYISEHWGRDLFLYGVIAVILLVLIASLWRPNGRRTPTAVSRFWLIIVATVFIAYTFQLRSNPEEAVHFVLYGILSILIYRALTHRFKDYGIYVVAFLLTTSVGIIDEALQWLTPNRVWGLKDIQLNATAAALILLGLAMGLRPAMISGLPTARTGQIICRSALLVVILLGISLQNTPRRISWYVDRLPVLQFIPENSGVMAEYGYLYDDAETGIFRSRFSPEELKQTDRRRATEAAARLDELPALDDYREFLRHYTPFNDPFLHEARVRLNRRDYYLTSADGYREHDTAEFQRRMTIAHFENRIMEKYFPETLLQSGFLLSGITVSLMKQYASPDTEYESAVSNSLITHVDEREVLWITLILAASLALLDRTLAGRSKT
jgi:VanZ family protein